jgi:arylsulfatase A-like enzyme
MTTTTPVPCAVCIVVDRLACGFLGCYGNSWVRTPAIDRLATESLVADVALVDDPRLDSLCRTWWTATHAARHAVPDAEPWPRGLHEQGIATAMLSDDPQVARHPLAEAFQERIELQLPPPQRLATDDDETQLAGFFAAAAEWLETPPQGPFLLWLHVGSLGVAWDAPQPLRAQYVEDEDDPPPLELWEPPAARLAADTDPDWLLGVRRAYAAQVHLLDRYVGHLMFVLRERGVLERALVVLCGARGISLGLHRRVGVPPGEPAEPLWEEVVHFPCLVRWPQQAAAASRTPVLVQPHDLGRTLQEWFALVPQHAAVAAAQPIQGGPAAAAAPTTTRGESAAADWPGYEAYRSPAVEVPQFATCDLLAARNLLGPADHPHPAWRDAAYLVSGAQHGIRTAQWYLRAVWSAEEHGYSNRELFHKPDDRWEVNDVAARCPQELDELTMRLTELRRSGG